MKVSNTRSTAITVATIAAVISLVSVTEATSLARAGHALSSVPRCKTKQLRIHWGEETGAAGTIYLRFRIHNISHATCRMKGFFTVRMLGREGKPLPTKESKGSCSPDASCTKPQRVILEPDALAYFSLSYSDTCKSSKATKPAKLRVTPPHRNRSRAIGAPRMVVCRHRIHVYAVYRRHG